eukprot:3273444-Karenia_brevis.AAC.1
MSALTQIAFHILQLRLAIRSANLQFCNGAQEGRKLSGTECSSTGCRHTEKQTAIKEGECDASVQNNSGCCDDQSEES